MRQPLLYCVQDCQKFGWPDYQWTEAGAAGYQMIYNNTNGELVGGCIAVTHEQLPPCPSVRL